MAPPDPAGLGEQGRAFFLRILRSRRCLDSQTTRDMLSDDDNDLTDISGGGDDCDEKKTYVLRKALLGLSALFEEDDLIEGKN